ncbi:type III-A CRISPR-associated RAMP protein Csm3 [Desulforhopalus vacuolatus]|uniref:type III-A CRISPR-associated RAMP protein Csm3 n=1 Tax=Desulforhopalus vacuolatus TaxID=40414 RepID=UPI0019630431|nr:type III-A CRISPR-associated RAMP protein Csm3 [Desulforhopalus vacuolatus]MBM9520568.1 type III-A CRISPR-associated RAMP protein Csm3 [Desulforhopalus vacuolatus]
MKLKNITEIKGQIILRSGLHIGAGDTEMRIGGTDNPVVKHPHSNEPFIPGSSLKGKVRSLLELRSGLMRFTEGKPVNAKAWENAEGKEKEEALKLLQLFGTSGADGDSAAKIGPTRASFSDCPLNSTCRNRILEDGAPLTEVKSENSIDRIRGVAESPRFTERVPAGMEFDFSITLKEMEEDDDLTEYLLEGLCLLELDALGGSGSRGYGRVEFRFADPEIQKKFDATQAI